MRTMLWLHKVVIWVIIGIVASDDKKGEVDEKDNPDKQKDYKIEIKEKASEASDLFPFKLPNEFETPVLTWNKGYMYKKPVFVSTYDPLRFDLHVYFFPPEHCSVGWLCFTSAFNTSKGGMHHFDLVKSCENSLRFHMLEQVVYVTLNGSTTIHPYFSPRVELFYHYTSDAQQAYTFRPYEEYDLEDFGAVKRRQDIQLKLFDIRILLLTSSPYCHATIQQPFKGIAEGFYISYMPKDSDDILKLGIEADTKKSPYFLGGTKEGSTVRSKLWVNNPSIAFDAPDKRGSLKEASFDCCPPTWEFEDFVVSSEWNTNPYISYQRYTLYKDTRAECKKNPTNGTVNTPFQSFLVEVGKRCEWIRLCFDKSGKFCDNDGNTLAFIFVHNVYIPTDSDNARPIALEFDKLGPIRINFLIGAKSIELAYAFSSPTSPGITELMELGTYDGMDPSKLTINVAKAPNCEARLLNDLAAVNVQLGTEAGQQCLSISSCTCLE